MGKKEQERARSAKEVLEELRRSEGGQSEMVEYDLVQQITKNIEKTRLEIGESVSEGLRLDREGYVEGQKFGSAMHMMIAGSGWGKSVGLDKMELAILGLIQSCPDKTEHPRESFVQGLHSYFCMAFYHRVRGIALREKEGKKVDVEGVEPVMVHKKRWADVAEAEQ